MSSTIFVCKQGGRTLWVPTHVATPSEAGSPGGVHVLSSVTPTELSRSFYLFEHEISVVPDPQLARQTPNGKTPADVVKAITDLRQACAADASEALRRCYDPKRPAAQPAPASYMSMPQQQQPQQHATSVMGAGAGGYLQPPSATSAIPTMNMSGYPQPASNAPSAYPAPQQQQQSSSSFMGSGSPQPYHNYATPYGPPQPQQQQGMMMSPYMSGPPPPQAGQMMGAGAFYPMGPYGAAPGYEYGRGGGRGGGRGRGGRGQGYMMNAYDGNMNAYGGGDMMGMGGMAAGVEPRRDAEPLQLPEVNVPEEVRKTYMNPQQPLVIASMPGPRLTAWLREFDVSTTRGDRRFVPCRGGIILMLKARGAEVEKAKPVELISKQICAHFLIHGYCSRPKCLHEHHTEEQVRGLIACRHVELKAMTKKERQEKIQEMLQREVEGEAEHEARRKEAIERRERGHAAYLERKAAAAAARGGGGVMNTADGDRAHDSQNARSPASAPSKPPVDLANLGVTDDDDDDSSNSSSSSSSSASSGSRSVSRERRAPSKEAAEPISATATTVAADAQPEVPPVAEEETHAADATEQPKPASKPSSKKASPKPSPKMSARKSPVHDEEAHSEADADEEEADEHTDAEEGEGDHDEHEHGEESEEDEEGEGHSEADEEADAPSKKAKKPAPKRKTAPAASKAKKKPAPKKRARSPAPKKAPAKRAKK